MTNALLQDAAVTLIALSAGVLVLRRAFGFFRTDRAPACANCPSSRSARRTSQSSGAAAAPATAPGSASTAAVNAARTGSTTHPAVFYPRPGTARAR